jgi:hypothetical protein
VLWYGFLGTFLGRKLLGLARLLQPLGSLGSLLVGIPGSKTAFANNQPFGWTEEFIAVRHSLCEAHTLQCACRCRSLKMPQQAVTTQPFTPVVVDGQ